MKKIPNYGCDFQNLRTPKILKSWCFFFFFHIICLQRANEFLKQAHWIKSAWAWDGRVYVLLQPEGKIPQKVVVRSERDLYDLFHDHAAEHQLRVQLPEETEGLEERGDSKEAEEHKENEGEGKEEEEETTETTV